MRKAKRVLAQNQQAKSTTLGTYDVKSSEPLRFLRMYNYHAASSASYLPHKDVGIVGSVERTSRWGPSARLPYRLDDESFVALFPTEAIEPPL